MRNGNLNWRLIAFGNTVHPSAFPALTANPWVRASQKAESDKRTWQALREFFREIFGGGT